MAIGRLSPATLNLMSDLELELIEAEARAVNNFWDHIGHGTEISPETHDTIQEDPVGMIRLLGESGLKLSLSDKERVERYQALCRSVTEDIDDGLIASTGEGDGIYGRDKSRRAMYQDS